MTLAKINSTPTCVLAITANSLSPTPFDPPSASRSSPAKATAATFTVIPRSGNTMPVLAASVSSERLFDVFMALLDPLGEEVDVVMESSHESEPGLHSDLYREHIDTVILKSTLYDYEQLLLNDGCAGLAALNPNGPMEVQFDEHKLLFVYAHDLEPFEGILLDAGLCRDDTLRFISEAEHLHSTDDVYREQFEELRYRLGIDV